MSNIQPLPKHQRKRPLPTHSMTFCLLIPTQVIEVADLFNDALNPEGPPDLNVAEDDHLAEYAWADDWNPEVRAVAASVPIFECP